MAYNNKGFSIVEVMIVVLVLALIGFIGWKVWDSTSGPKPVAPLAPVSEKTQPTDELKADDKTLDNTNVEGDEASQLESEVNF